MVLKGFVAPVPLREKPFVSPLSTIPARKEIKKGKKDKKLIEFDKYCTAG